MMKLFSKSFLLTLSDVLALVSAKAVLIAAMVLQAARSAHAAPGDLDTTFGSGGKVTTPFMHSNDTLENANGMAIQPDGRIVLAGYANTGANVDFLVARYLTDGTLDTTFGDGGRVTVDFGLDANAYAVALRSDGKIVIARAALERDHLAGALAPDGSLDTSFDGDGLGSWPSRANFTASPSRRTADRTSPGRAISRAVGISCCAFSARTCAGCSFDGDGIATVNMNNTADHARDLVIEPDGKIVLAGYAHVSGDLGFRRRPVHLRGHAGYAGFGTGGKRLIFINEADRAFR